MLKFAGWDDSNARLADAALKALTSPAISKVSEVRAPNIDNYHTGRI
jgi:hypothetical protein